ncbi:MAG: transglutaminase-like domain-containing protein [Muribaculaceae bacterium]|nr:transglutaminase-like domain-containing protein [Muribaculaceae bacterium]
MRYLSLSIVAIISMLCILTACNGKQASNSYIHQDFLSRQDSLKATGLFKIFESENLIPQEREAMEFLYAYMPLPDMTDYTDSFYLDNVRLSLKAREEMPWGKNVPDREFRHFVLPVRINNENLDSSRMVFYNELKDRVKGLSMADAILEINHWCHEKVTYRPSDGRTSSPLASVRTAWGRCGEESTFAVAALRAMGIPARQVYTPRWAHTDDNHAWVEAWADGKWYFLGACEPEAILNLGWFNAPAARGMMMNTKVLGRYDGPEEVLATSPCYTEINVTENYAPVADATVTVIDKEGKPVAGADVEFKIYNYAEFYTLARKTANDAGQASLTTGLGDMLVWAAKDGAFGFNKVSVKADGANVTVVLDLDSKSTGTWEWDVVPPVQSGNLPTPEQAEENSRRLAQEDSIRTAYTATFYNRESAARRASELAIPEADQARVARILQLSEGNHAVIEEFIASNINDSRTLTLLEAISEKDLKDIDPDVLADRMNVPVADNSLYGDYILSPRVSREMLSPWYSFFAETLTPEQIEQYRRDPMTLAAWCNENIAVDSKWNPQSLWMKPESAFIYRITDSRSRELLFVTMARACGIPARIDPVTGKTQYTDSEGNWISVSRDNTSTVSNVPTGTLKLGFTPTQVLPDPAYYYHFTLSKIENGSPVLLNYPDDAPWSKVFADGVQLDCGQYLLTSGQRLADGSVLSYMNIFEITPDVVTTVPLTIRHDDAKVQVLGSFNSENIYHDTATDTDKSILSTTGRGYYILGLLSANHEPTVHALNDLSAYKDQLEKWGAKILLLNRTSQDAERLDISRFENLPSTVVTGIDTDGHITDEIITNLNLTPGAMPVFIVADTFNRVVFVIQGYNIGLGKQIIDTLNKI